jgi:uncharacterized protein (DUF1499 family)
MNCSLVVSVIALFVLAGWMEKTNYLVHALSQDTNQRFLPIFEGGSITRQDVLNTGLAGLLGTFLFPGSAVAFENKISTKYDDRPKRRGSKPTDLGVMTRTDLGSNEYQGLKHCGAAPNCFVSSDPEDDDKEHWIPAWTWPKEFGNDREMAFIELASVIESYQPGQSNVDGGGFRIITNDPKKGYIYTQFESLKNGYIDDVELAFIDGFGERAVQVRSSSRLGYLDFGVNAKRLNYIAKALRAKGWDAPGVDYKTHQNYVIQNELE